MAGPSRRHVTGSLIAASLLAGCASPGAPATGQVPGPSLPVFTSPSTGRRGLIHRPPGQASRKDWPLVIWLHGFSLRGNDPRRLMAYGLPRLISALPGPTA